MDEEKIMDFKMNKCKKTAVVLTASYLD